MSLIAFLPSYLKSQYFEHPKLPTTVCAGRTIIVTGANVGLGKEAARHFVSLNAAKVIIACRTPSKGEAARADIEKTTKRTGIVEVWSLDLESYDSIREFVRRAETLDRVDVVLENAGKSRPMRQWGGRSYNIHWNDRSSDAAIQAGQRIRDRHFDQRDLDVPARSSDPTEAAGVSAEVWHAAELDHRCV
jgi:NAD(P)-dependent dehydrogenase (short-subunit alcohol dehydrogenase family)